jgi:hypothetical protein
MAKYFNTWGGRIIQKTIARSLLVSVSVLLTPATSFAEEEFSMLSTSPSNPPIWIDESEWKMETEPAMDDELIPNDGLTPEERERYHQEDLEKFAELEAGHQELMQFRKWKERVDHMEQAVLYCCGPLSVKMTLGFILMEMFLEENLSEMWPHFAGDESHSIDHKR